MIKKNRSICCYRYIYNIPQVIGAKLYIEYIKDIYLYIYRIMKAVKGVK